VFDLCEILLKVGSWPERAIAFDWAFRVRKQYEAADFERFERWLDTFVDDWGPCDVMGLLLMPASRHHIVHFNEALKLKRRRR